MTEEERTEDQRRYVFSSNLKLKLSNFMTAGQVRTSMAVDAQRIPIWGETWVQHTWWEVQPHFAVLQRNEEAPPPSPVVEIEQTAPPRVEQAKKK
jgi:hypothetical protein